MDADVELQAAKTAGAPELAPYEYTSAEAYLHKAREEQGYADFEVAIGFANSALQFAKDARRRSMEARVDGVVATPSGGVAAPAPAAAMKVPTDSVEGEPQDPK